MCSNHLKFPTIVAAACGLQLLDSLLHPIVQFTTGVSGAPRSHIVQSIYRLLNDCTCTSGRHGHVLVKPADGLRHSVPSWPWKLACGCPLLPLAAPSIAWVAAMAALADATVAASEQQHASAHPDL